MDVQLPDGTLLQGIPDGTTKAQIAEKLKTSGHAVPDDWLKPAAPTAPAKPAQAPRGGSMLENADIAVSTITSGLASLAGGVVKAGGYANQALGISDTNADAAASKLEDMLTWQPKTDKGKAVMADVAKGLQAFEDWSDKQGEGATKAILAAGTKASEVAKSLGAPQSVVDFIDRHKDQVASAYGAATKTAINAVPLVAGDELGKIAKPAARVAGDEAVAATEAPRPAAPTSTPAPAADLSVAPSAPRPLPVEPPATAPAPLSVAPSVPRATPNTSLENPLPPTSTAAPATPRARAQAYVRDRLGLSWDALAEATQKRLETVAHDAQALDRVNPDAIKRQAHLDNLRVPIKTTAGRLSRDDAQLIKEEGVAGTNAGKPIRDIDIGANRDLRRNVETLVDRLRGVGQSRAGALRGEKVGEVIAGRDTENPGILTKRERQSEANVRRLYDTARKTDPDVTASTKDIQELATKNPAIQHLNWVPAWFKKASIAEGVEAIDQVKLKDLQDLRTQAVGIAKSGGPDGFHAGQVIEAIDKTMEEAPETAKAWKAAQQAFREHKSEFSNQTAIARLLENKGGAYGSDPKTALEDVWKVSVKNARLEEVRQLKRSLLGGKDAETRLQGKQALRTLRAATAQDLLEKITSGVSTNEAGEANITADSINKWIKSIGQDGTVEGGVEKLEVIFGRKAARELMDIREAAQITKTAPTTRVSGSNTFQNILNWMEDTGIGGAVKSIGGGPLVHLAEKAYKATEAPSAVRAAKKDALSDAERAGQKAKLKKGGDLLRQREEAAKRQPTYGAP